MRVMPIRGILAKIVTDTIQAEELVIMMRRGFLALCVVVAVG